MDRTERFYKIERMLRAREFVPIGEFLAALDISAATFKRDEVEITDALKQQVVETVAAVRALLSSKVLPPPVNDQRCPQCSLREICQPEALAATGKLHRLRDGLFDPDAPL